MSNDTSAFKSSSLYLAMKGQSNYYQLLFPYLQLDSGPKVTAVEIGNAFFTNPESLNDNPLFQVWSKAKEEGSRTDLQTAAVDFINSDQFIRYPQQLLHPMAAIGEIKLERLLSIEDITHQIEANFKDIDAFSVWLASSDYQANLSRVWLSVFSLLIILDYEVSWLDQLISLLASLNFLEKSVNQIRQKQPGSLFHYQLWSSASLRLPSSIFPLPKALTQSEPLSSVRPYSIGTLHRIEYKLVGYELGELRKIESLLQGELREKHHDFTMRKETGETINQDRLQHEVSGSSHNEHDLLAQVQQTLGDRKVTSTLDNYATQYIATSANASTTGSWTIDEKPAGDEFQKSVDVVKDILSNTERRVIDHINNVKHLALSYEQVSKESHRFNNDSNKPINGFYYWLNKRYRVQAIESQKRLMIEVNLDFEGSDLQALLSQLIELKQTVPKSLKECEVSHYSDIHAVANVSTDVKNNDSRSQLQDNAYYLNLYQIYEIDNIVPPPNAIRTLSRSVRSESRFNTQEFNIPKDYVAKTLKITALIEGNVNSLTLLIAGECFDAASTTTSGTDTVQTDESKILPKCTKYVLSYDASSHNSLGTIVISLPNGIEGGLCFSLSMTLTEPVSRAQDEALENTRIQKNTAQIYTINLDLALTPEAYAQWQLGVYEHCNQAFLLQWQAHQYSIDQLKERLAEQDNKVTLSLINRELVKMSIKALFDHAMCFVANDKGAPREQFPYQQYFDNCLDWQHLYCQLIEPSRQIEGLNERHEEIKGSQKDETVKPVIKKNERIESFPILTELDSSLYLYRFLMATKGKVLVPVKQGFEKPFNYFFDTGRIWHGKSSLTPVNQASLPLINDYQQLHRHPDTEDRLIDRWQVSLPTTMSVIASNDDLYRIGEHLDNEE